MRHKYYDFFAGGGMAGLGLGPDWSCVFANDIDKRKESAYRDNHNGGKEFLRRDVKDVMASDLAGEVDLAWASFPCQDLSLAGNGAGLKGERSGTFWSFMNLMRDLKGEKRAPRLIVLENVYGAVTSHGGKDFSEILIELSGCGYQFGALVADAIHFVPQSRPRLFIIALREDLDLQINFVDDSPTPLWHPSALIKAQSLLSKSAAKKWIWWKLPAPLDPKINLSTIIEDVPTGVEWHSSAKTKYILSLMSELNLNKVHDAMKVGKKIVGTVYRRTRPDGIGGRHQRAEVRFDGVAGCLRTPTGGSSRQTIIIIDGNDVRSRLLSTREAARLMGLPDNYKLPENYNAAYHIAGDGVVVPVVRHLATHIFDPILKANRTAITQAA